jgi:hypothetical protein
MQRGDPKAAAQNKRLRKAKKKAAAVSIPLYFEFFLYADLVLEF